MRKYEETHRWLKFACDLDRLPYHVWMNLGEARSKCEHIAGVPLAPNVAQQLRSIYLSKGALATTAIEGNTLSDEQVRLLLEKRLSLPKSKEYLAQEVQNILDALEFITERSLNSGSEEITVSEIKEYNRIVLTDLETEPEVAPGEIRQHSVMAGKYLGAPAENCEYLLERLCQWLNDPAFYPKDENRIVFGLIRAILAHLYLAWIHPFGDGNGRTARLLEVKMLLAAGVPTPGVHLLSNHYNQTRSEYYRQLDRASRSGGDIIPFLAYAIQGFADGLKEQLDFIGAYQWGIAWRDFVFDYYKNKNSMTDARKRHLLLDLSEKTEPVPASRLREISPRVAEAYATKTQKTLMRDIGELMEANLIRREKEGYVANQEMILAFLPPRAR